MIWLAENISVQEKALGRAWKINCDEEQRLSEQRGTSKNKIPYLDRAISAKTEYFTQTERSQPSSYPLWRGLYFAIHVTEHQQLANFQRLG